MPVVRVMEELQIVGPRTGSRRQSGLGGSQSRQTRLWCSQDIFYNRHIRATLGTILPKSRVGLYTSTTTTSSLDRKLLLNVILKTIISTT